MKNMFEQRERAVSPVIGVILMVAIVVILGAVVAAFALGFTDDVTGETAPSVSFDYDDNTGELVHNGGDAIDANTVTTTVGETTFEDDPDTDEVNDDDLYTAGSMIIEGDDGGNDYETNGGALIWEDPSSDDTQTLHEA